MKTFQFTNMFPVSSNSTKIWDVFDNVLAKAVQPRAWPPPQDQHSSWLQGTGSAGLARLLSGRCSFSSRDSESQIKLILPWFRNCWCPVQPLLHQILKVDTHALPLYSNCNGKQKWKTSLSGFIPSPHMSISTTQSHHWGLEESSLGYQQGLNDCVKKSVWSLGCHLSIIEISW